MSTVTLILFLVLEITNITSTEDTRRSPNKTGSALHSPFFK